MPFAYHLLPFTLFVFKVGVGLSKKKNPFLAGEEAGRRCLAELGEQNPDICLLFSSVMFANVKMLAGIRSVIADSPLFGLSDAGEITSDGSYQRSVVLAAIKSDSLNFAAHLEQDIGINPRQKGRRIAETISRRLPKKSKNSEVLIIFSDGLSGSITDVIRGAQEILGTSFPILGGGAGDNFLFQKTYQYYNDRIFSQSALGLLIQTPKIGFGMRHGWRPLGRPYRVTRAKKNVVWELNEESAIEVYQSYFGKQMKNLEKKFLLKMVINYPLGMSIPGEKEYLVRNVLDIRSDGSLVFSSDIPEGREVRLMMSNKELVIAAARDAAWQAIQETSPQASPVKSASPQESFQLPTGQAGGAAKPLFNRASIGIIFNSASRYKLLGEDRDKEVEEIKKILSEIPLIGFYGYSQQAPLSGELNLGQSYSHNQTVVVLVLGE